MLPLHHTAYRTYLPFGLAWLWTCMTVSYSVPTTQSTIVTLHPQSYLSIYPSVPFATDTNWDGEDSNLTSFLVNLHCHSQVRRDQRRNLSLELRPIVGVLGFEPRISASQMQCPTVGLYPVIIGWITTHFWKEVSNEQDWTQCHPSSSSFDRLW